MAKTVTMTKKEGRLTFGTELAYLFSTLQNGTYQITVKKVSEKRSIAQNDLLWMWMKCIENETGTPKDEVYMYYCKKFLMRTMTMGQKQERIYLTSSKLNMEQRFSAIVEAFQKMPESAEKSALAVEIFGKQGQELMPL